MDLSERHSDFSGERERHFWELARADFLLHLLKKHLPPEREGTLLDIGCGDGYLLHRMGEAYPSRKFAAVDPALDSERIARIEATVPGRLRAMRELPPETAGNADAVTLFDLLEHIEDDRNFLRSLSDDAAPGTLFFITVPAGSRLYGEHDRRLRHFRRYDRSNFRGLLKESQLEILELRSFFSALYPIRQLELLCGRTGGDVGAGAVSPPLLNAALRSMLYMEARLEAIPARIGFRLPGLSLEAVCRK